MLAANSSRRKTRLEHLIIRDPATSLQFRFVTFSATIFSKIRFRFFEEGMKEWKKLYLRFLHVITYTSTLIFIYFQIIFHFDMILYDLRLHSVISIFTKGGMEN